MYKIWVSPSNEGDCTRYKAEDKDEVVMLVRHLIMMNDNHTLDITIEEA